MHKKQAPATINGATIMTMVAYIIAPFWLAPAIFVNVDWSKGLWDGWNWASVGSILASAVFMEGARRARSVVFTPVLVVFGFYLVFCNVQVAFENVSHRSDDRSDHRRTAMVAAKNGSSQRSQWSQGRTEAATIAGEKAPSAFEADIQALIAKEANRWRSTEECRPDKITAGPSREFCSAVAELRSKLEAAKRRDTLDAQIKAYDEDPNNKEIVTSADPFADNLASFLLIFNVRLSDDIKTAISAQKDITRSIALEVVAALGPSAWLLMVSGIGHAAPRPTAPLAPPASLLPVTGKSRKKLAESDSVPGATKIDDVPPLVAMDDPFLVFVAARLEDANGAVMKAAEPWQMWLKWCAETKNEPGSQKVFGGKMKTRFAHENNNNRPRYLNVRAKQIAPSLRVVGGNSRLGVMTTVGKAGA